MTYTLYGKVVLPYSVIENGAVTVEDGKITFAGDKSTLSSAVGEVYDYSDSYIAPGYVDIHCHAGGEYWSHEEPEKMAAYHLAHGTTSILCTIYRGFTHEQLLSYVRKIKAVMTASKNIKGVHLEGPYLNAKYGSCTVDEAQRVIRDEYMEIASEGVVRQWTFSPEEDGTLQFVKDITEAGIVGAIGHSCASPEQVYAAHGAGAKIVTHLFDATGTSKTPSEYDGTIEVSFDCAALLCDDMYYEIICDSKGVHVRGDMVKLAVKTVGVDRIIGVTDCCTGDDSDTDINVVDGELYGSKLTMDKVAKNFRALGFTVPEVYRITSLTPASVCNIENVGKIEKGYNADLLILNDKLDILKIFTSYN